MSIQVNPKIREKGTTTVGDRRLHHRCPFARILRILLVWAQGFMVAFDRNWARKCWSGK